MIENFGMDKSRPVRDWVVGISGIRDGTGLRFGTRFVLFRDKNPRDFGTGRDRDGTGSNTIYEK